MKNKQTSTMSEEKKKSGLVPRLRFPEFRDAGEWENKSMGALYSYMGNNSLSRDKLNYESGTIKNIHYGDIHTKFAPLFNIEKENVPFVNPSEPLGKIAVENYCTEGDMVFADASEDLDDIGKCIELVNLNGRRLLSGLHTILARRRADDLVIGFGGHLFHSDQIRIQIKKESQGTKVLGLSTRRLSKINVCFPSNKREQQKVADCLSSLDALINAEVQKLEALKIHKKSLMQQLFPCEGETVPRLRFLEFRDAGDWDVLSVGEVFSIYQGFAFSSTDAVDSGVVWLKIADVGIQKMSHSSISHLPTDFKTIYRKFLVKKGDYVLALTRPILNKQLKIAQVDVLFDDALLNQRVGKIESDQCIEFVYFLLQTSKLIDEIEKSISGSEPPNLSAQQIRGIMTCIPSRREQHCIADCLSSLDDLITAQDQKIDALKTHKKGLMQQLFPTMDEVQQWQ